MLAPDLATYAAFAAQAQRPLMSYSGVPSGCATPETPHTFDTLPPLEDPSSPSYCATPPPPKPVAASDTQLQQQVQLPAEQDHMTMFPVLAPMCFLQSGVQKGAVLDPSNGGGATMMHACMVPAGSMQGWVMQSSQAPSMEQLPWAGSQAPSLDVLPWAA